MGEIAARLFLETLEDGKAPATSAKADTSHVVLLDPILIPRASSLRNGIK
jgi:hypothetical protein